MYIMEKQITKTGEAGNKSAKTARELERSCRRIKKECQKRRKKEGEKMEKQKVQTERGSRAISREIVFNKLVRGSECECNLKGEGQR